jgi:hypothetical protein
MRSFLAVVLTLCLVGSAGAATIRGTARGELLPGTLRGDLLIPGPGRDVVDAVDGNDRIVLQYDGAIDAVSCGAGRDVVNADLADRVARDCEVVSRRLSRDIYANGDSRHETQVEPDSFTFDRTTVAVFQTARRFEGGAANIAFATSSDNGLTWRGGELPGITKLAPRPGASERASDPVVAYDAVHRVWLASSLAVSQPTRLTINRSPDGLSWSDPTDAASATLDDGIAYDKQWLTCDNGLQSPFRGRCYLAYSDFVRRGLSLQTSTDGGLTWSQPVSVAPLSLAGAFPAIQPNGTLVIVYRTGTRNRQELAAVRSRDGGSSLEQPVLVSPIRAFVVGLRLPVLPAVDVDPSGRIWVTWHDCVRRRDCLGNDVVVSTSTDGVAWSRPRRITSGRTAAIPAIAADPASRRLAILYYVVRPAGIDAELVESRDAGATWGTPQRLSAQTMQRAWSPNTTQGRMLADYISVSYAAGRPLAVWALASEPAGAELRQAIFATRL